MQKGDEAGLRAIFDEYYQYLFVVASQYIKDYDISKDIVQDVFYELWKKRDRIDIQTSLKAYLRRATINRSLNWIKREQKLQWGDDYVDNQREDEDISPQQRLELKDLQDIINHTINQLPERCRVIFKLSRIEQLSHKEISEQLNISTKTIENQMTKALKSIRKAVQQYGLNPVLIIISLFFS